MDLATTKGLNGVRMLGRTPWGNAHNWSSVQAVVAGGKGFAGYEFEDRYTCDLNGHSPEHLLEMAIFKGRLEIQMDGRPLYLGPIDYPVEHWDVIINQFGLDINFRKLELYEILDDAEFARKVKPELEQPVGAYASTQLTAALWRGFGEERIKKLLDLGANPNTLDRFKRSAVHLAIEHAPKVLPLLLKAGGTKDEWVLAALGDLDALKSAVKKKPVVMQSTTPFSLVHAAASAGQMNCLRFLVNAGAIMDSVDACNGESALHFATREHQLEAVNFLLFQGADYTRKNSASISPWEMATGMDPAFGKVFEEFDKKKQKGEVTKPIRPPEEF